MNMRPDPQPFEIGPAKPVAVCIFCKTPSAGFSKTRLSPPLRPEECSQISACFIRDLSTTIAEATADGFGTPFAVYTPAGSETALRTLLPAAFELHLQGNGGFGSRLLQATEELIADGHAGVILINSDSPTLPAGLLRQAIRSVARGDTVVLGPAIDGGYTLIGMSQAHARLFDDIPWSTEQVFAKTLERAAELGLAVETLPTWYDVDDAATLELLIGELNGKRLPFAIDRLQGAPATATRAFLQTLSVTADRH